MSFGKSIAAGASLLTLLAASLPGSALAEPLSIQAITANFGDKVSLSVPSLEADDASLDEATIRALFQGEIADNAQSLAALDAARISIPQIVVTVIGTGGPGKPGTVTLSDVALEDVEDGIAGSISIGGMVLAPPTDEAGVTFGALTADDVNIAALLGFYGLVEADPDGAMQTIYTNVDFAGATLTSPAGTCEIGPVHLGKVNARPLKMPFSEMMTLAETVKPGEEPSPEVFAKLIGFYADILTAVEVESASYEGLDCAGVNSDGQTFKFAVGTVEIADFGNGFYPDVILHDLDITTSANTVKLGSFELKPIDFNAVIARLDAMGEAITPQWFTDNARTLVPAFQGLAFSDLKVKGVSPDTGMPIDAGVANFDLTLGNYVNGIPADFSAKAAGITADLPGDDERFAMLAQMGIDTLNLGFNLNSHWDEGKGALVVDTLSFTGDKIGTLALSATLGNATQALFSADNDEAMAAAMALTVQGLSLHLQDDGFLPKVLELAAADQGGQDVDTFRNGIAAIAQATAAGALSANPAATALGKSIAEFIRQGGAIDLSVTAKDPAGLDLQTLMGASSDPSVIAGAVDITASTMATDDAMAGTGDEDEMAGDDDEPAVPATHKDRDKDDDKAE